MLNPEIHNTKVLTSYNLSSYDRCFIKFFRPLFHRMMSCLLIIIIIIIERTLHLTLLNLKHFYFTFLFLNTLFWLPFLIVFQDLILFFALTSLLFRSSRKLNELTSLYQYIELQVDEANTKLDSDWEERKMSLRRGASNINQVN